MSKLLSHHCCHNCHYCCQNCSHFLTVQLSVLISSLLLSPVIDVKICFHNCHHCFHICHHCCHICHHCCHNCHLCCQNCSHILTGQLSVLIPSLLLSAIFPPSCHAIAARLLVHLSFVIFVIFFLIFHFFIFHVFLQFISFFMAQIVCCHVMSKLKEMLKH